ncbi:hypothetical protein [Phyllobacterium endophyticum]|uniref:hypothetical protein n=1 Tax=Phyllobacterium endophyticum TaxID=1149773 RepID=UPI0011C70003|nr:hypothetical protein [Phyllobacterium endophyticum]TXR46494.1 hypothetical protein FVA77_24700 [Phyllobacterium endophyticum]
MQNLSVQQPGLRRIEASVIVKCPVEMVLNFYRDFKNLPRFLGHVSAVKQIGPNTYRWMMEVAFGFKVPPSMRITEVRENGLVRYEMTTPDPHKTIWKMARIAKSDFARVSR